MSGLKVVVDGRPTFSTPSDIYDDTSARPKLSYRTRLLTDWTRTVRESSLDSVNCFGSFERVVILMVTKVCEVHDQSHIRLRKENGPGVGLCDVRFIKYQISLITV